MVLLSASASVSLTEGDAVFRLIVSDSFVLERCAGLFCTCSTEVNSPFLSSERAHSRQPFTFSLRCECRQAQPIHATSCEETEIKHDPSTRTTASQE